MHVSWLERLVIAGYWLAFAITAFFSFRYVIRFGQQVKRNRAAGVYDDPEFKRRIKPLNIWRYGLAGAQGLVAVVLISALEFGLAPETVFRIGVILVVAILVPALVVERRWRKLMIKGIVKVGWDGIPSYIMNRPGGFFNATSFRQDQPPGTLLFP